MGFALSPTGADHLVAAHDPCFMAEGDAESEFAFTDITDLHIFGVTKPLPSPDLSPDKVRLFTLLQSLWSLYNVLDICIFVGLPENRMMRFEHLVDMVKAATGWNTSIWELVQAGERSVHLTRAFNISCGLTKEDDSLPMRLHQPLKSGAFEGFAIDKKAFDGAIDLHYQMMGWDQNGVPIPGKLEEMNIGWVNDIISQYRK
jgi:aldehyde:ferredoxin oxidoreductase